ncbi:MULTISPECIES: iron export ABC transporter permease subunit FetB [unclassified Pseudodesulfovibrio]|uniref:ABC transporter permease n=1 Tax=unclassified Pseudodesulfovibrio TaxID=2661612 RepID=UPI000FEBB398|nr:MULTISPECIES: iron export ABC transporter permease subunit FetB [unclassified Pseudodesulfovibrio]MCJ2166042.1 iron export ABC transporter permease subunit FetB [Pseudodesulfovibrio sp. S3-i]RWU02489.1 iron export ABC transporter permease subunit FetB [Pseudodesulfovibrio sp. S3]
MTPHIIEIGPFQLVLCLGFVLLAGITSMINKLGLGRDLLVGTVRTFAQLFLMGYVLKFVFELKLIWLVLLMFLFMVAAAVHTIRGRVKERSVPFVIPTFLSMIITYTLVSMMVTGVIVGAKPWWTPQYFIPLAGMIVGNSMTAISICLERLFSDLKSRRGEVEMKLALGADFREASQDILGNAVRAGMIPSINSLMAVGLVSLPGMMTGQILSGTDPLIAIRYQIVVMLMLVASTSLGALIVTNLVRKRCFSKGQQLLLR